MFSFPRFHIFISSIHIFISKLSYFHFPDFIFFHFRDFISSFSYIHFKNFTLSLSWIAYFVLYFPQDLSYWDFKDFHYQDFLQRTLRFRTMNCYSGLLFHFVIFRTIQFRLNEHEILPTSANSGQIRSCSQVSALFSRELN